MSKPHYFDGNVDKDDIQLQMSIRRGYVPSTCLLGGATVWGLVMRGDDPCKGCEGPREKCKGRPR